MLFRILLEVKLQECRRVKIPLEARPSLILPLIKPSGRRVRSSLNCTEALSLGSFPAMKVRCTSYQMFESFWKRKEVFPSSFRARLHLSWS